MTNTKPLIAEATRLQAMPFAESLTMLLYGGPGVGKTFFCGTAGDRTLYFDIGSGIATLQAPDFTKKYASNPLVVRIPLGDDSHDMLCDTLDHYIQKRRDEFDTVVVDDASSLRRGAMIKAVEINMDLGKSSTGANAKKHGMIVPVVQDYGEEMSVVEKFLADYTEIAKASNLHLLITAHEKLTYKKGQKIGDPPTLVKIRPAFTGQQFPDTVPAFFDEVWRFYVVGRGDKKQHRIITQPSELLVAKSRHGGVFLEEEKNLDFPTVVQRIKARKYIPTDDGLVAVN